MKFSTHATAAAFALVASRQSVVVDAQRTSAHPQKKNRKLAKEDNGGGNTSPTWTTTNTCSCYEYLTDPFFRDTKYNFDELFSSGHHYETGRNQGYYHMAEFCCEFAAELVDPVCEKNAKGSWMNAEGGAPVEPLICDMFDQEDITYKLTLQHQARNACYCFYRDIGCGRDELGCGGYCDYAASEVTLDDFRMANNSAHNMCNSCLERDLRYDFPTEYEGQSHDKCLGYCLLKRGDPNDVYAPTVSDERCCFDEHGLGLEVHGFETDKIQQEIMFMPFEKFEKRTYDYFFNKDIPLSMPPRGYEVNITYDGLSTARMTVERYGNGDPDYPPAEYYTYDFHMQCQPEDWDALSVHVFDESSDGGIVFRNVTLDGVDLGTFGFAVQEDPSCSDVQIIPDILGMPGHNYTCISRPGGYGHLSGFLLRGFVELTGSFVGDDIGVELIVGCKKKQEEHKCCTDCCCGTHHHHTITGVSPEITAR